MTLSHDSTSTTQPKKTKRRHAKRHDGHGAVKVDRVATSNATAPPKLSMRGPSAKSVLRICTCTLGLALHWRSTRHLGAPHQFSHCTAINNRENWNIDGRMR